MAGFSEYIGVAFRATGVDKVLSDVEAAESDWQMGILGRHVLQSTGAQTELVIESGFGGAAEGGRDGAVGTGRSMKQRGGA